MAQQMLAPRGAQYPFVYSMVNNPIISVTNKELDFLKLATVRLTTAIRRRDGRKPSPTDIQLIENLQSLTAKLTGQKTLF
jgi:hypothetical protein